MLTLDSFSIPRSVRSSPNTPSKSLHQISIFYVGISDSSWMRLDFQYLFSYRSRFAERAEIEASRMNSVPRGFKLSKRKLVVV
jgi:hypothetical protein